MYNYLDFVPKRFKNCSFDNYTVNEKNKTAFNLCKDFCSNYENNLDNGNNLLICGNVGVGKTHLAYSIKKDLHFIHNIRESDIVITTMMKLLDEIKQTFSNNGKFNDYADYPRAKDCKLLLIDEIGVQYGTNAERVMMYDLFDYRYSQMKSTIAMSNLDKLGLSKVLGQRITDRLAGSKYCKYYFINDASHR